MELTLPTLTVAACLLLCVSVRAGELTAFKLESQGVGGYRLQARGLIDAPRDAVWWVLTDYPALHRVSPRIIESDLSHGYARWRLHDRGDATGLDIDFELAMDSYSWVPSFVSRIVVGSALKADAEKLIEGIERAVRLRSSSRSSAWYGCPSARCDVPFDVRHLGTHGQPNIELCDIVRPEITPDFLPQRR